MKIDDPNIAGQLLQTKKILDLAKDATYKAGQVIFKEGEKDNAFYMILEGRVAIKKKGDKGEERIIAELGPGEFFGEKVLLGKKKKPATAEAIEKTQLLVIPEGRFSKLIKEDAETGVTFLLRILDVVGERLTKTNNQLIALHRINKLLHLYKNDLGALSKAMVDQIMAITDSDDGAVFLKNPYSQTNRTVYTAKGVLKEGMISEFKNREYQIFTKGKNHYLIAALDKEKGFLVFTKNTQKKEYTDDQLRLLILAAEQFGRALQDSEDHAAEKAREMLHHKRFTL